MSVRGVRWMVGVCAVGLMASALVGCTQQVRDSEQLPSRGVVVPTPDKSVFMRASFDDDPSNYIGRFLPDSLKPEEVDENQGVTTRCSDFITYKEVGASGSYDEYYNSSTTAGGSVGVPGVASASAQAGQGSTVRVRYDLQKKMRAEIADKEGFEKCCAAAGCPAFIIGEFYKGTGEMYQAVGAQAGFDGEGMTPEVMGEVSFKDEVAWRRSNKFQDVYFAFRKQRVTLAEASDPSDCSWAQSVPTSLDGTYFVGISEPSASEATARDIAMRNARTQVVKFIGEFLTSSMKTKTSAVEGVLEDETVVTSAAEGLVSRVKDKKWCAPERLDTPKGSMYIVKVLAYLPNEEKAAATQETAKSVEESLKSSGKLTPELAKDLKAAASAQGGK